MATNDKRMTQKGQDAALGLQVEDGDYASSQKAQKENTNTSKADIVPWNWTAILEHTSQVSPSSPLPKPGSNTSLDSLPAAATGPITA